VVFPRAETPPRWWFGVGMGWAGAAVIIHTLGVSGSFVLSACDEHAGAAACMSLSILAPYRHRRLEKL
jgi:hypothetical protein